MNDIPEHPYVHVDSTGICDQCGLSFTNFVHVVGYREHGVTTASPAAAALAKHDHLPED